MPCRDFSDPSVPARVVLCLANNKSLGMNLGPTMKSERSRLVLICPFGSRDDLLTVKDRATQLGRVALLIGFRLYP